jgi:putative transposase
LDGDPTGAEPGRARHLGFALIQRCQVHKGRNIIDRLDPSLHAGVKKVLRQAWDSPTAEQAERVLENLARSLDHHAPGVSASILSRALKLLSLTCTDAIAFSYFHCR